MDGTRLTPLGKMAALVLALLVSGVVTAAGASAVRPHDQAWRCVIVQPGDTLWDLARGAGSDVRSVIHEIADENGLSSPSIQPGSALWIPATADRSASAVSPEACPRA
jgi:hypothetical protein